ncbi:6-hydroxymethylpterin diphosphokinase MptE-like protein [Thermosyntropha sp.]|uniref:motility associated factor glycosyltransferase family protein n=1 Tax=Thermosyntropha sp. TaxID=2740820 RepID=UPI0025E16D45|nr:6-hydroxymethylpterin diphosphokinase MptE-like protein [Thermosyntropha sp.]MBO8159608.1 motility associated factor glycosyltransferase family protein [Thermosyntropha sp.]
MIEDILKNKRVAVFVNEDKKYIIDHWKDLDKENSYLLVYNPSLSLIPEHLEEMKVLLQIYRININSFISSEKQLNNNFSINKIKARLDYTQRLNNILYNVPMILASAGPSLSKNLEILKLLQNKFFIGCVGTALKPLLIEGIIPDMVMITDPSEKLYEQFIDVENKILSDIPLFYFGTVAPMVIDAYPGPKIMLLQRGFDSAEELAAEMRMKLIETGGSVATALLDWMVKLGGNPICFIGQDLAYSNNMTHHPETHNFVQFNNEFSYDLLEVDDYFLKGKIKTSRNLFIYKKWIENYVTKHGQVTFINATQGGAFIKGCRHISLKELIDELPEVLDIDNKKRCFKETVKLIYKKDNFLR